MGSSVHESGHGRDEGGNVDEDLLRVLRGLPDDVDPHWPPCLARDVITLPDARERLLSFLRSNFEELRLRFSAFYAVLSDMRRNKDFTLYREIFHKYVAEFRDRPMALLLESQLHLNAFPNRVETSLALEFARRAHVELPDHFGVTAHLAECIACAGEVGEVKKRGDLEAGVSLLDRAIAQEGGVYGRYWVTRAKLEALLGDYDSALAAIDKAIDLEPSGHPNYAIRVGDFQAVKLSIQAKQQGDSFGKAVARAIQGAEEVRYQLISALGVLTAAIAFIVSATQIATHLPFSEASRLVLIAAGSVAMMFASFAMLSMAQQYWRVLLASLIGVILIAVGFLLHGVK